MNLLIHHWDTDGICSAALLVESLKDEEFENISLFPGIFEFDGRIRGHIAEAERIYIVDVNMVDEAEVIVKPLYFFDHHIQRRIENENATHVNPLLEGKPAPSASYVVSDYFNHWGWQSAIGAVGDLGRGAFQFDWVRKLLDRHGLSENQALHLARLINSPSMVCDLDGVEGAVERITHSDPLELLNDDEWTNNLDLLESEIAEIVERAEDKGDFVYARYSSRYNVTSIVARRLVWDLKFPIAIVVNEDYNGHAQIYIRVDKALADRLGIADLIRRLKSLGFNAGGKSDVLGIICAKTRLDEALSIVGDHFGWLLWWKE
ncbi:DHH family phosphoesterase [Geoglobus acetivorans]|uniref:DHH family protein n=1 Tax=Geoglobus acetivorans TaxID=565033 RepID=A0ABZ3H5M4_GEOAI|nr:DHH family phosphoesterase [Geoglobus acetivorans]